MHMDLNVRATKGNGEGISSIVRFCVGNGGATVIVHIYDSMYWACIPEDGVESTVEFARWCYEYCSDLSGRCEGGY